MSDYTVDVRAKVTPEQHRVLSLYAQLQGMEIAEVVRSVLLPFLDDQVHKATVLAAEAQREGIVRPHVGGDSRSDRERRDGIKTYTRPMPPGDAA